MTPASVKEKLHEYIEQADEKKVQAIYTLVASEIEDRSYLYDEATLNALRETSEAYASGKIRGFPMEQSLERIKQQISKK